LFLLEHLPLEIAEELTAALPAPVSFEKGDILYAPEDYPKALCLILDGEVKAMCGNFVLTRISAGGAFGVAGLFDEESDNYVSQVYAVTPVIARFISEWQLIEWLMRYPAVMHNMLRFLTCRIRFLNARIGQLVKASTGDRVYQLLFDYRQADGCVRLPYSLRELAARLDIGRSTLYRTLEGLTAQGLLTRRDRALYLQDKIPACICTGRKETVS